MLTGKVEYTVENVQAELVALAEWKTKQLAACKERFKADKASVRKRYAKRRRNLLRILPALQDEAEDE